MTQAKNTICPWYEKDDDEAANFYAATFRDSEVTAVYKAPGDFPGWMRKLRAIDRTRIYNRVARFVRKDV